MLFSSDILENIKSVQIDEKKDYSLTRFGTENGKSVVKESDHNPIIGKLRLHVKNVKKERVEMFNLRNTECQKQFKEVTDKTDLLSTSIREDENIEVSFERFLKNLNRIFYKTFKKIRICPSNRITEIDKLMERRRLLRSKKDPKALKN